MNGKMLCSPIRLFFSMLFNVFLVNSTVSRMKTQIGDMCKGRTFENWKIRCIKIIGNGCVSEAV